VAFLFLTMSYTIEVPIDIIHLDEDGYHIFLEGHINEVPARFLLDTGASKTVINEPFAIANFDNSQFEENPKGATGISGNELKCQIALIEQIHLGLYKIENLKTSIILLSHVNETYAKLALPSIDAIIGMDILVKGEAKIHIDTGILELKMVHQPHPNYYTGPISH
jgi:hypothetical protein